MFLPLLDLKHPCVFRAEIILQYYIPRRLLQHRPVKACNKVWSLRARRVCLQACGSRLLHQTLALNRRLLVSPTEVHPLCVLHQCYCFANAEPPSSHLLLTPHSYFSHPVLHHTFPLQGSKEHGVGGPCIGLLICPPLQGGRVARPGPPGGFMLHCRPYCSKTTDFILHY